MENEPTPTQNKQPSPESTPLNAETREKLVNFLRDNFSDPVVPVHAEIRFKRAGLTEILEEAGILSPVINPNPVEIGTSESKHDQWWTKHPEAGEAFDSQLRERDEIIMLLYLGAMIGPYMRRVPVPESPQSDE